jgi:hypothetical protein
MPILPCRERHRRAEGRRRRVAGGRALRVGDSFRATRKAGSAGVRIGVGRYRAARAARAARSRASASTAARSRTAARTRIARTITTARRRSTARPGTTACCGIAAGSHSTARSGTARSGITAFTRITACGGCTAPTARNLANTGVIARATLQGDDDDCQRESVSPRRARHSILAFCGLDGDGRAARIHAADRDRPNFVSDSGIWLDQIPGWTSSRACAVQQGQRSHAKPVRVQL